MTSLTLNRLGQRDVAGIIRRLVGNKQLPVDVTAEIVERSDGIPLFVEEMTKAVLEAESESAARRTIAAIPSETQTVPASLHASLMARLDRLGPAKEVAQIGAAIGREFSHALLASVARDSAADLEAALDRLIQAGLVFRHGVPPHATYLFNHALVQDAAYGTLLRRPRRALHARIVKALESQFAEIAESQPELLAHHCDKADLIEGRGDVGAKRRAVTSPLGAGRATAQLNLPLPIFRRCPPPALRRDQIKLQVVLITPLIHVKGYAAPDTKALLSKRVCSSSGRRPWENLRRPATVVLRSLRRLGRKLCGIQWRYRSRSCGAVLNARQKQNAKVPLMMGHRLMGTSLLYTETSRKGGHIMIRRSRFTILPRTVRWRAIRSRRRGGNLVVSIVSSVVAWLPRGRTQRLDDASRMRER